MDENAPEKTCACGRPAKCGWCIAVIAVVGGVAMFFGVMAYYFGMVDKAGRPMLGTNAPPPAAAQKPPAAIETVWVQPKFPPGQDNRAAAAEARAIAEEAYLYGFPMVINYKTMYDFNVDKTSPQYKGPFNRVLSEARVFTPKDTTIVTPNSDTPYSMLQMDLRAEPLVLTVPEVEKGRYYSVQLIDMYTFNYGYIGSRTTGNGGGAFLVAGPSWKGETPAGVKKAFRCETDFSLAIFRTQLFNAADMDNVRKIQAGYNVQTLSEFMKKPTPPAPPKIVFDKIDKDLAEVNPFGYLSFVLQFCPPVEEEKALRAKFAKIGIVAGKPFDAAALSPMQSEGVFEGAKSGMGKIKRAAAAIGRNVNGWRVTTGTLDRAGYRGDWLARAAVAAAGVYANDSAEAMYPMTRVDADGAKLDGAAGRYTLSFASGQLPPVNAFWSVTMYDGKTQLLVENPIHRYLINSPMLPGLKKNADGSLTIYIQKDSPGKQREANWLPAPDGPICLVMRLYWPKQEAIDLVWKPPAVKKVKE